MLCRETFIQSSDSFNSLRELSHPVQLQQYYMWSVQDHGRVLGQKSKPYFGLERTWNRVLGKAEFEKSRSNDEVKILTEILTCLKPFYFGGLEDIFENGNRRTDWTG